MSVRKYRKKPVIVEAVQFKVDYRDPENPVVVIDTLEEIK